MSTGPIPPHYFSQSERDIRTLKMLRGVRAAAESFIRTGETFTHGKEVINVPNQEQADTADNSGAQTPT